MRYANCVFYCNNWGKGSGSGEESGACVCPPQAADKRWIPFTLLGLADLGRHNTTGQGLGADNSFFKGQGRIVNVDRKVVELPGQEIRRRSQAKGGMSQAEVGIGRTGKVTGKDRAGTGKERVLVAEVQVAEQTIRQPVLLTGRA